MKPSQTCLLFSLILILGLWTMFYPHAQIHAQEKTPTPIPTLSPAELEAAYSNNLSIIIAAVAIVIVILVGIWIQPKNS